MSAPVTIRDLMEDENLFGSQFGGESFAAWRALLSAFYGLELSDDERATLEAITGRDSLPESAFAALWLVMGRRGGKSLASALIALYQAAFHSYHDRLAPGEIATALVIAGDRDQARAVMRYVKGMAAHPMIEPMIRRQTETSIEFTNRTCIEIATASFRSVRGYSLCACITDEIAYWSSEGANPDKAIIQAIRPALATLDGKLIALSSPYARRGELWNTYKRHYGKDSQRVLVAQAPSRTMNPTLPQAVVDEALVEDYEAAQAEYMAQFRSDIAAFLDVELLDKLTRPKPLEIPPSSRTEYLAFVDPAGGGEGSGADEFTLAIGHREGEDTVIDLVRGAKGSPAQIVKDYAAILRSYGVQTVTGDRYAARWPRDEFLRFGIVYEVSKLDRSGLYLELLAAINSGRIELPPCEKTKRQLAGLERRTSRSGRDSIDHGPNGHDDRSNAIAGLLALSKQRRATSKTMAVKGLY